MVRSLDNVCFKYKQNVMPLRTSISISSVANSLALLVLVQANHLVNLISRLYDVEGRLLVGGHDVKIVTENN